jgi:hypothetical protein
MKFVLDQKQTEVTVLSRVQTHLSGPCAGGVRVNRRVTAGHCPGLPDDTIVRCFTT